MKKYWIAKSEPTSYSWNDLVDAKEEIWDGIRNYQARNNLKEMQLGDLVFFYHSGKEKAIVGIAEVSEEGFADPTDEKWVAVKLKPKMPLNTPISLAAIKDNSLLAELSMLKQSRLSLSPVSKSEFDTLLKMSS